METAWMTGLLPLLLVLLQLPPGAALLRHASSVDQESLARRRLALPIADFDIDADGHCGVAGQSEQFLEKYYEYTKLVRFGCKQFRLGNALMQYWNARALAYLNNFDFQMTANRTDFVSQLPSVARAHSAHPESQDSLWSKVKAYSDICATCSFPHGNAYAPWRLYRDTILHDTVSVVESVISKSSDRTKRYTDWKGRQTWAVLHYRCDATIWKNEQYGFFRHSFLKDRLPSTTTHMMLVGQVHSDEPLCQRILQELVQWLQKDRKFTVAFQETDVQDDWLTLATAPILFCTSSTYCLTAAMGNPHTVYYPVNGKNMAVVEDGPEIQAAAFPRPSGFHWVPSDYIPGPAAADLKWEDLQAYFRADRCDKLLHQCVPVGGHVPDKYFFHGHGPVKKTQNTEQKEKKKA